jgi:DOPA 4,5-dioxygenase
MQDPGAIRGFHAHIYYDAHEAGKAQAFAERARAQFTLWALHERGDLTLFCHGLSADDLADHTRYVVWFGASEPLNLSMFG